MASQRRNHPLAYLILLVSISLLGMPPLCHAYTGTEGAAFLNIPVGADPAAMGSAYTALANDAYAPVWNPAGLGFLESTQLAGQHLSYLDSLQYEFASFVHPLWKARNCGSDEFCGSTAIGVSAQYLGASGITGRDNGGNLTGDFSSHYGAYTAGIGHAFTDRWSLGASAKGIQAQLADVSAGAYAADVGTMYKATDRLTLAGVVANLGTKLTFLDQADPLPLQARVGAAYDHRTWRASVEGVVRKSGLDSGSIGMEWRPLDLISLRTGYRTDTLKELSPLAGFSTGVGINVWGQEFAYAWVPYGELGNTQYFSLLMRWGEAEERKRNLIYFHSIKSHREVREDDPNSPESIQLMELLTYSEKHLAEVQPLAPVQPVKPESPQVTK